MFVHFLNITDSGFVRTGETRISCGRDTEEDLHIAPLLRVSLLYVHTIPCRLAYPHKLYSNTMKKKKCISPEYCEQNLRANALPRRLSMRMIQDMEKDIEYAIAIEYTMTHRLPCILSNCIELGVYTVHPFVVGCPSAPLRWASRY